MEKIILIDVETTGLSAYKNGILQIAGCIIIDGQKQDAFNWYVKPFPDDKVEQKALDCNGTTLADIETDKYRDPIEVYNDFTKMMLRHINKYDKQDKLWFMAYNASFDSGFIRSWLKKCGDNWYGSYFWTPYLDVMQLCAFGLMHDRHKLPNFKLGTIMEALGVEAKGDLHDADVDITGTLDLFYKFEVHGRDPHSRSE